MALNSSYWQMARARARLAGVVSILVFLMGFLGLAPSALAQTAANPLRPTAAPRAPQSVPAAQQASPAAEEAKTTPRSRKKKAVEPEAAPEPAAAEDKPARKLSPGQQAARQRQKQCGEEWRAQKAAGKIPEGQKWPQYWSACNARLKAKGA